MRAAITVFGLILLVCGCKNEPQPQTSSAIAEATKAEQCMKDTDCKGDRICVGGVCSAPQTSSPIESLGTPVKSNSSLASTASLESASGSDEDCIEGLDGAPVIGSKYNDGIYLCREPVEAYWNDWFAIRTSDDKLRVQSEGKTSGFDGTLNIDCATGASSWGSATNFTYPLASEKDIAAVVPRQAVSKAKRYLCNG